MKEQHRKIIPGQGLDGLLFGSSRAETERILGKPERTDHYSYGNEESDKTIAWLYDDLGLSVHFDEDDEYRLGTMEINSDQFSLNGNVLIGQNKEKVLEIASKLDFGEYEEEDESVEEIPNYKLLSFEKKNINLWFQNGTLTAIQWSPLWLDENTQDWPIKKG